MRSVYKKKGSDSSVSCPRGHATSAGNSVGPHVRVLAKRRSRSTQWVWTDARPEETPGRPRGAHLEAHEVARGRGLGVGLDMHLYEHGGLPLLAAVFSYSHRHLELLLMLPLESQHHRLSPARIGRGGRPRGRPLLPPYTHGRRWGVPARAPCTGVMERATHRGRHGVCRRHHRERRAAPCAAPPVAVVPAPSGPSHRNGLCGGFGGNFGNPSPGRTLNMGTRYSGILPRALT